MNKPEISRELLAWYDRNARGLPWRESHDPYRVWVSEVMLQQTRVDTVIPYYRAWLEAFPDIQHLAAANERQVMQLWEGLGYYSRARNMLKTARLLVEQQAGRFPDTVADLKKLPGIGDYIAGALASIAFGRNEVALDGNGLRVLARLAAFDRPINETAGKGVIRKLMQSMLPPAAPVISTRPSWIWALPFASRVLRCAMNVRSKHIARLTRITHRTRSR